MKPHGISSRIEKVNEELEKLAGLIENDQGLYSQAREALMECNQQESSDDSSL